MIFTETNLKGAYILEIRKIEDERGFFGRSWCKKEMEDHGLNGNLCQANTSYSRLKGTIRGMHYQVSPYEETKLIRCTRGSIYDVIIDLRPDSETYLKWFGTELNQESYNMLYVPEGFAHGFITLQDNSEVYYNVTQFYIPGAEAGIRYNDPLFNIHWPVTPTVVSDKDSSHPDYKAKILVK